MKTTKNAHGVTAYSRKYTHAHELHMAGKGTEKMRQVGATVWHYYTLYLGGGRKKQVKWYNTVFLLNLNLTVSVQLLFVASVASLHSVVAPMSVVRHLVDPRG
jgi:hypothetical protein